MRVETKRDFFGTGVHSTSYADGRSVRGKTSSSSSVVFLALKYIFFSFERSCFIIRSVTKILYVYNGTVL
jgi:hypothetical protein